MDALEGVKELHYTAKIKGRALFEELFPLVDGKSLQVQANEDPQCVGRVDDEGAALG
jgi:hypothetical protein